MNPPITKIDQYFLYSKIQPNCFLLFDTFIIIPININIAGAKIHLYFSYIIIHFSIISNALRKYTIEAIAKLTIINQSITILL